MTWGFQFLKILCTHFTTVSKTHFCPESTCDLIRSRRYKYNDILVVTYSPCRQNYTDVVVEVSVFVDLCVFLTNKGATNLFLFCDKRKKILYVVPLTVLSHETCISRKLVTNYFKLFKIFIINSIT